MWLSVSVASDAEHAEALSDALMEAGALSVSIEDADAGTDREEPQFGEPGYAPAALWRACHVVALFDADAAWQAAVAAAAAATGLAQPEASVREVAEENWVQLTQSQFEPIRITDRLWIVPSWHEAPVSEAINIQLDPGMAFGTGSHPTTHLCLNWLSEQVKPGQNVLDYGSGSGILAIAAAKLGAASVLGVDIDPKALEAALDNAARNGVTLAIRHSSEPLAEQFDLVVANILTNPLCVLAPLLASLVAPGGRLALTGILDSQVEKVQAAYQPFLPVSQVASREGWVLLEGARP